MNYYFTNQITGDFDDTIRRVMEGLAKEGFGVLTEIDVRATLKKKLDVDAGGSQQGSAADSGGHLQ